MGRRVSPKEVEAEYTVIERWGRLEWEQKLGRGMEEKGQRRKTSWGDK